MSVAGVSDRSRYTDSWSALLTPRISLVELNPRVTTVGHCSNGRVQGGAACWVGTRGGAAGWVPGVGYYPCTQSCPRIGIARAQPMTGQRFLRPLRHSRPLAGPSAHLSSSHSTWSSWIQYGRDSIKYILKLVDSWSVTEIVA